MTRSGFTYLGINITHNFKRLHVNNFTPLMTKLKSPKMESPSFDFGGQGKLCQNDSPSKIPIPISVPPHLTIQSHFQR